MSDQTSTTRNDNAFVAANSEASGYPDVPSKRYTETQDTTRHSIQTVDGNRTSVDVTTDTDTHLSGEFDNRVMELIDGVINERERRENIRANHRNLNRMLTLFGALLIGLVVTFVLTNGWLGPMGHKLAPYAFVITILMDSGLALYGYIRHY